MRGETRGYSPDNETYDVSKVKPTVEKISKSPKKLETFRKMARNRAEDIFESGHLAEKIKKEDKVLYLGTGSGHVPQYIEEQTGAKVFKFDLANLKTPDTQDDRTAMANARYLPIADNSLDVVCLFDILHHTKNQEEILKEANRVLKPGGKILLMEDTIPEEINIGGGLKKAKAELKKKIVGKMDDAFNMQSKGVNPHNYKSISDWEATLGGSNFQVNSDDTLSWHWGVPDFVGADRSKRPDEPTLMRPFQATMLEGTKPPESKEK